MSVLDPRELEASPLADLHALAAELGVEGFRRLRKEDLIRQIVEAHGGEMPAPARDGDEDSALAHEVDTDEVPEPEPQPEPQAAEAREPEPEAAEPEEQKPRRRRGLGLRRRAEEKPAEERGAGDDLVPADEAGTAEAPELEEAPEEAPELRDDARRDEAEREDEAERAAEEEAEAEPAPDAEPEDLRTGVLDVLPNGSGFMRAEPFRQSRDDVYVSPAQIRRCELRPGDEVSGPVRPPRRNERHPSLVRVDSVNGAASEPPAERPRFEELTPTWARERLAGPNALSSTPFGRGSRVAVGGPPGAGATRVLREAVKVLRDRHGDLEVLVVLAGVRPEEVVEWNDLGVPVAGGSFEGSVDEQAQIAELAVQRAKRAAEAGRDAVVVIDSLDALPAPVARRVFGAGRNTEEAGSVTVLASTGTAAEPHRMATTHVTLEPAEGSGDAKVSGVSGTLRRDLLA
jgi:transcription termination factor Rho